MGFRILPSSRLLRYIPLIVLVISLLIPLSESPLAQVIEVSVQEPQLYPAFTTCPETYWYPFANNLGHTTYLTLNAFDPYNSTNHGEWHPNIPQSGYYQVKAYIAGHSPITWCTGNDWTINHDTTDARYTIHHSNGITTRSLSQYPLNNQWLDLGEYYFRAGTNGYVSLTDLNGESEYSTTVSFSAMKFTFTRLVRPQVYMPLVYVTNPSAGPTPDTGVIQGQGFDACHLPAVSEMQTWWNASPYTFYGLYLGGIHLPSICSGVTAAWVSAVHQQGWSFVPTWVGPQAPCTDYHYKMSSNPAVSYQEGRQEAQAASTAAAALGLTNDGLGGTIIYYDLEAYGVSTPECRQPVSAFMNGWVERLHELGNLAGGYGTRNSYVWDWATIPNVPDSVWPASWYTNHYDPAASVFGITWLDNLWTHHQRIRQYAGDHYEIWGGKGLAIDSDVADGIVAMPPVGLLANPTITFSASIEDAGWLSAEQGWMISNDKLYWTNDQGINWQDISPAPVQIAYFLRTGDAWALATQDDGKVLLYRTTSWGTKWEQHEISLPPGSWRPLQVQFVSPTFGWVVMQKETSQAFNIGTLMRTNDGGLTWITSNLPMAAAVNFLSDADGWLVNHSLDTVYHTTNGGRTWQSAKYNEYPLSVLSLPDSAIRYGWQADGLGWAVTSTSSCNGEKASPGFTCQSDSALWQSLNGGQTWEPVPLPGSNSVNP